MKILNSDAAFQATNSFTTTSPAITKEYHPNVAYATSPCRRFEGWFEGMRGAWAGGGIKKGSLLKGRDPVKG